MDWKTNIVKMLSLPNLLYRFNTIPLGFFLGIDDSKNHMKMQRTKTKSG